MPNKLAHEFKDFMTPWGPTTLTQQGKDKFTVTYGKQVDRGLTYPEACYKLGQAQMHWLACQGKLDNRQKGEA
jgi:hypothetical protein